MSQKRPNPDVLLKQVKAEEARHLEGKLKVFFGANPGVGKTYAMSPFRSQKNSGLTETVQGPAMCHRVSMVAPV